MPFEAERRGGAGIGAGESSRWSIDGVAPERIVHPATPQEVAEALADAAAQGLAVAPVGAGTALALGNVPERYDVAIDTTNLGGIIEYEPTDLVLSVGAGAQLGDVQAVLTEHGQMLPIDPPAAETATIGGLIATALAGPRRLSAGTLRDLLIGISAAHTSGTVTKAGGMVVKNVTGFDLPRLYHGSLGTLGVIVSANFKVLPTPRAEATLLRPATSLVEALAATDRLRSSRIQPDALEAALFDGGWLAAVRLTGREGSLPPVVAEARGLLEGDGETLEGRESAAWWGRYADEHIVSAGERDVLLRLMVRPRESGALAEGVIAFLEQRGVALRSLAASVGLGAVLIRVELPDGEGSAAGLGPMRNDLYGLADHVTILAAPPAWKHGIDVWGRPPEALDVMRALKAQFDPGRVLNRGRFAGFI